MTDRVEVARICSSGKTDLVRITNASPAVVDTHLLVVVRGLPDRTRLLNASGITSGGDPFVRVFLDDGVLLPGQSIDQQLRFAGPGRPPVSYTLTLLSGQGSP